MQKKNEKNETRGSEHTVSGITPCALIKVHMGQVALCSVCVLLGDTRI